MTFRGFRAIANVTSSGASGVVHVNTLGTEEFDTENAFASSIFTVPAALDGQYMVFNGGAAGNFDITIAAYIQSSTDGGVNWNNVSLHASAANGYANITEVSSRPVLLVTGHQYRLAWFRSGVNVLQTANTFFSGYVIDSFRGFSVFNTAPQDVAAGATAEIIYGGERVDTEPAFVSNRFTVPASMNGKYMRFQAGAGFTTDFQSLYLVLERSTDGGANWGGVALLSKPGSVAFINMSSTPVLLTTGHLYRMTVSQPTTAVTLASNSATNTFSGYLVD